MGSRLNVNKAIFDYVLGPGKLVTGALLSAALPITWLVSRLKIIRASWRVKVGGCGVGAFVSIAKEILNFVPKNCGRRGFSYFDNFSIVDYYFGDEVRVDIGERIVIWVDGSNGERCEGAAIAGKVQDNCSTWGCAARVIDDGGFYGRILYSFKKC